MKSPIVPLLSLWVPLLAILSQALAQEEALEPTFFPTSEPEPTDTPTVRTFYLNGNNLQVNPPIDPTQSPTTNPPTTPAPTEGSLPIVCFPGDATVMVKSKGKVPMKELQLGDKVYVGDGKFEEVYSFGHYDPNVVVGSYLEIHANNIKNKKKTLLRISPDHMIFSETRFVPSSNLKAGDQVLMDTTSDGIVAMEVQSIKNNVNAIGAYAPFTTSGQIVVNDVVASNYIALLPEEENLLHVSHQWLAHSFGFPHRFICRFVGCYEETYDEDGVSNWVSLPLKLFRKMLESEWKNIVLFTFVIPILTIFAFMEYLLLSPTIGIAMLISTMMIILGGVPSGVSIKYRRQKTGSYKA